MPIDFNENRAEYFPASDLAAAYYFDRAGEVLGKWTARHVETVNDGAAGIGYEQARGHGQGRGLARAVGADHAVDGAGRDGQGEHVDGDLLPEGLAQSVQSQRRSCGASGPGRR